MGGETQRARAGLEIAGVALLMLAAGYAAFFIAPEERSMGPVQRIFYFHVASAWTAFVAFFVVFLANIAYLAGRNPKREWLATAGAEVGMAFCTVVLVTGPIWARPVWNTWWAWDARLTSTLVLWLLYAAYLLLRGLVEEPERRARIAAIYGIFAFLDVPLVYFSIRVWRTHHPAPVLGGGEGSWLDPAMRSVLFFCWLATLAMMALLLRLRYRLEGLQHEVAELGLALAEREARAELQGGRK
jgi:heme exporter protein C